MPRGAPDYLQIATQTSRVDNMSINANVFDTGFSRLDGGGRVVYYDDFREGINRYEIGVSGGASVPSLTTAQGVGLGFSLPVMLDPVGNNASSTMRSYVDAPISGKMGVEVGFYVYSASAKFDIRYSAYINDGTSKRIRFTMSPQDGNAVISTPSGDVVVKSYANSNYYASRNMSVKVVCNPLLETYDSILISGNRVPLSYEMESEPAQKGAGTSRFSVAVVSSNALYVREIFVNYVIITADEP